MVPVSLTKYSLGMDLSICLGSWTWRYSYSLSEYLAALVWQREGLDLDPPAAIVDALDEFVELGPLGVAQRTRLLVPPAQVDVHEVAHGD
jgi:hypothetical protein